MKSILFLLGVALLSSCSTSIGTTKNGPITDEILSKLKASRNYRFDLISGRKMKVHIEKIEAETITGYSFDNDKQGQRQVFSDTYQNLKMNVVAIRKYDPVLTTVAIIVPTGAFLFIVTLNFGPYGFGNITTP